MYLFHKKLNISVILYSEKFRGILLVVCAFMMIYISVMRRPLYCTERWYQLANNVGILLHSGDKTLSHGQNLGLDEL